MGKALDMESSKVRFNFANGYWFTKYILKEVMSRTGCFETTLDIGFSKTTVCFDNGRVRVGSFDLDIREIDPSEEDRVVLLEENGNIYEVVKRASGFYKLKAISCCDAPTLEINGIHMHRVRDITPLMDSKMKVRTVGVKKGDVVLDTCMGLGYTAILSAESGARKVFSFEIDENVIWIAERNPWSRKLASPNITVYNEDVVRGVTMFPEGFFDKIIHDPPRFSGTTGDLYSLVFYRELYRVLKPGGVLFHYTGEPRRHGAPRILKGIKERLSQAGFRVLRYDGKTGGFVCYKPF